MGRTLSGASHSGSVVKTAPASAGDGGLNPWVRKSPWRRKWQPHSNTLAWEIPWIEEPGRLQSMGWQRVGHDWVIERTHITLFCWWGDWSARPWRRGAGSSIQTLWPQGSATWSTRFSPPTELRSLRDGSIPPLPVASWASDMSQHHVEPSAYLLSLWKHPNFSASQAPFPQSHTWSSSLIHGIWPVSPAFIFSSRTHSCPSFLCPKSAS